MTTDTRLEAMFQLAPVTVADIKAAAMEYEEAVKPAREKWQAQQKNAINGDSIALLYWADGEAEYREVVRVAHKVYLARIGE